MIVHHQWVGITDRLDERRKAHAMAQAHSFHGKGNILDFKDFVVVSSHQPIKRVPNKAEAEVGFAETSGLKWGDQLGFAVGVVAPESIRCGFDPAVRAQAEQSAKAGLDRGIGHFRDPSVHQRNVPKQDEVTR